MRALLDDRQISLEIDDKAIAWLAKAGYDPVYGARPLKRMIQKHLQDPLATRILEGRVNDGETVRVTASDLGLFIGETPETRQQASA